MFKNKKILWLVITALIFSLALGGCGNGSNDGDGGNTTTSGDTTEEETKSKDTLVVAQGAKPKSLDPHATNDQPSSRISKQIYNTLVASTEKMEIVPCLAESWEQLDPLIWEFKLVEGVKFHNGEELKASDVVFTLNRMKESPIVAELIGPVSEVEAKDEYTVTIKTSKPFVPLIEQLAHPACSILNEKAVTESGDDYGQNPVGTGPFKLPKLESADKIELERFDDYFMGPAKIEKVIFRNIPEGNNRALALESEQGNVDIAYDIEAVNKPNIMDKESLELIEDVSLSNQYIGFNMNKKPFDDIRVRQAINYAVDVQEVIDIALEGAGEIATSPLMELIFGADNDIEGYPYDVEKAKALLKEAGYENGFKTTLWTNDSTVRQTIAEVVQAQLKEVGIDIVIEPLEWSTYLDKTAAGEHDMFILGWTTVTGDADYGLYQLYHSSQQGGAGNRTFYNNPEVDELLDAGRVELDREKRLDIYQKAQNIIVEEAPNLFLYFENKNVGIKKNVKGFKLHPAGHHTLYNVYFE